MKRTLISFLFVLLAGFHSLAYCGDANSNRANLQKVKLGMTKEAVLDVMGDPYKFDASLEGKKTKETLYYITLKHRKFQRYSDKHMSKIVLENERVIAIKGN